MEEQRRRAWGAGAVFLALLGVYLLTAPGRIDIIDGQWRYEAARNWLDAGEPSVRDPYLSLTRNYLVDPQSGRGYAIYNAGPSVAALPAMALSRALPGHTPARDHFAFSLTGVLFGALAGGLLVLAYGALGVGLPRSVLCAMLFGLATLWWPASLTVFDQNQHAVLLLASLLLAWLAGRRQSTVLAALAGGIGGLLFNYQETYGLVLPVVGLAVLGEPVPHRGVGAPARSIRWPAARRYLIFGLGCCLGLGLLCAYNYLRVGSLLTVSRFGLQNAERSAVAGLVWGNPVEGLLGLALSPGKGILWYSPPLLLAMSGIGAFRRRAPRLALAVGAVSAAHLLLVIHLSFFGGDWCWGPRYVVPLLPLWALLLPFGVARLPRPVRLLAPLAVAGIGVQLLGVSVDHQRFFFERNFPPHFWQTRPWVYFQHSQLLARPGELMADVGPIRGRGRFSPAPTGQATYCLFGPPRPDRGREWVRNFAVFYLPRPWWGWLGRVPAEQRPVPPAALALACGGVLAGGGVLLLTTLRSGGAGRLTMSRDEVSVLPESVELLRTEVESGWR